MLDRLVVQLGTFPAKTVARLCSALLALGQLLFLLVLLGGLLLRAEQ